MTYKAAERDSFVGHKNKPVRAQPLSKIVPATSKSKKDKVILKKYPARIDEQIFIKHL
jgi:hypothetical protein